MKLRNLTAAIRKVDGAPTVGVMTPLGYIHVPVQKSGLMEALKSLRDDPTAETHMEISDDGRLIATPEGRAMIDAAGAPRADTPDLLDLEDDAPEDIEDSVAEIDLLA